MSETQRILATVKEILSEALGLDADEIQPESKLIEDLGAESIDILDISFRLEEEFDVSLPTREWTELFSAQNGQLDVAELAEHLKVDFSVELSDAERERYADASLKEILDGVEAEHGITIDASRRHHYAELGTQALLDQFGTLLLLTIEGDTRERVIEAATSCGYDESFWSAVVSVFTVAWLVHYVERKLEERSAA